MLSAIGKFVGGKVVTALCVIASLGAGIWFWRHPDDLRSIWAVIKYTFAWIGFAAVLPWTSLLLVRRVARAESNFAAGAMLAGYTILDTLVALWLAGWHVSGALSWTVVILGLIAAGAYNYVVCESLARHAEG